MLRAVDMQFSQGFEVRGRENAQFILKKKALVGFENTKQQNNKTENNNQTALNFFVFQTD